MAYQRSLQRAAWLCVLLAAAASACAPLARPIRSLHGFVPEDTNRPADVVAGEDTRTTVLAKFGNPSTVSPFEPNIWYYVTSTRQAIAYRLPKTVDQTVTVIAFDDEGAVTTVEVLDITQAMRLAYATQTTPTRGRQLNIIEQLLGNVGTLPGLTQQPDPSQRPGGP